MATLIQEFQLLLEWFQIEWNKEAMAATCRSSGEVSKTGSDVNRGMVREKDHGESYLAPPDHGERLVVPIVARPEDVHISVDSRPTARVRGPLRPSDLNPVHLLPRLEENPARHPGLGARPVPA